MAPELISLISLLGIWILFFWLYRDYRNDKIREELFSLRDTLFQMAKQGEIEFDSKAYGRLRSSINATIRNAHKITLLDIIFFDLLAGRHLNKKATVEAIGHNWKTIFEEYPKPIQNKLFGILNQMYFHIFDKLVFTSALMVMCIFPVGIYSILRELRNRFIPIRRIWSWFKKVFQPLYNVIDFLILSDLATEPTPTRNRPGNKLAYSFRASD